MNTELIRTLVTQRSGQPPEHVASGIVDELAGQEPHPDVVEYLSHCLPISTYAASGVRVLPIQAIEREMGEASAPGSFIRPFGYVIIAISVGGNAICAHASTGRVFWANHDSFSSDTIMFENRATRDWEYLYEYSSENVERAMLLLSENVEAFFTDLLADRLSDRLDELD